MKTVVLLGTLDTKGAEYAFMRERLEQLGVGVTMVDAGVLDDPTTAVDISREQVAEAGGRSLSELVGDRDRGEAIETMASGATEIVRRLHGEGRLDGILALGGSSGTSLATRAMRELPVGVPKLMVSTMASGDTRPYVGAIDLTMMYSVVDIAGVNSISRQILANAACGMAGMVAADLPEQSNDRPLVGASMFGVTTPCVEVARERLEELGYEVLVFHATGTGGQSMEALMRHGFISAALDITTTELADDLVGGVLSAGPDRLEAAGELGLPQVVSLGALDMVNFGPPDSVPPEFQDRLLYRHNPTVTLMRTTVDECRELGRRIAQKLNRAKGPLTVFIPLRGLSLISKSGEVFADPEADRALVGSLRENLSPQVEVREVDTDVNNPEFARNMADTLDEHYRAWSKVQAAVGS